MCRNCCEHYLSQSSSCLVHLFIMFNFKFILSLRGESHIDFLTQSVIMTLGCVCVGGGGEGGVGITNDVLKFKSYRISKPKLFLKFL